MTWRLVGAWMLLVGSILGMAVTFPLWLLNLVSDRALLGVTLVLSWLALVFEAANMTDRIHDGEENR